MRLKLLRALTQDELLHSLQKQTGQNSQKITKEKGVPDKPQYVCDYSQKLLITQRQRKPLA